MNNANTQHPEKKPSITKLMLQVGMIFQAGQLLTNGGRAPIPHRLPNQRQRRKRAAQTR